MKIDMFVRRHCLIYFYLAAKDFFILRNSKSLRKSRVIVGFIIIIQVLLILRYQDILLLTIRLVGLDLDCVVFYLMVMSKIPRKTSDKSG